jgi:hypothetical protein
MEYKIKIPYNERTSSNYHVGKGNYRLGRERYGFEYNRISASSGEYVTK